MARSSRRSSFKIFQCSKQVRAKFTTTRVKSLECFVGQKVTEESLSQIFGVINTAAAPSQECVKGVPVFLAELAHGIPGGGIVAIRFDDLGDR